MRLSDDQLSILRELNADARHTEESLADLADECDDWQTVLCELADADQYDPPYEWPVLGDGGYGDDSEIPF